MWWASEGGGASHTPHGISLMRAMCMRSTAVLLLWFLLNMTSSPDGGGAVVASKRVKLFRTGFSFIHSGKPNKIVDEVKIIYQCFVYLAIYRKAEPREPEFVYAYPACSGSKTPDVSFTWRHL
jgi:hypothetical protein